MLYKNLPLPLPSYKNVLIQTVNSFQHAFTYDMIVHINQLICFSVKKSSSSHT